MRNAPVHAGRLDRWLTPEVTERVSFAMKDFYAPVALAGVPGAVYAAPGGDFYGDLRAGWEMSASDRLWDIARRFKLRMRRANAQMGSQLNTGFASLAALLEDARNGQHQTVPYNKTSHTHVANASYSQWFVSGSPTAGSAATVAPGGDATDNTTSGAAPFTSAQSGNTAHLMSIEMLGNANHSLFTYMLYDRLFQVRKTMNSNAAESVTGVPARYQSSTRGDENFAGGNFLFIESSSGSLAAGAHNHNVVQYRNQAGTDAQSAPSMAGISGCVVNRLDMPVNRWFMPLAAGDDGIMDLHQIQYDTSLIASGQLTYSIGHPLAWMPSVVGGMGCRLDGLNTAFSLVRIFNGACLSTLTIVPPTVTGVAVNILLGIVEG